MSVSASHDSGALLVYLPTSQQSATGYILFLFFLHLQIAPDLVCPLSTIATQGVYVAELV